MTTEAPSVRVAAGLLLSLAVMSAATAAADPALAASSTAEAPATPEAAVEQVVTAQGAVYAGDCASTRSPQDVGKVCARFAAERSGMRAYLAGRTFSEFTQWVFVAPADGGWRVVGTAPLDFFATTPTVPWPH